jgi:hypothetical protein
VELVAAVASLEETSWPSEVPLAHDGTNQRGYVGIGTTSPTGILTVAGGTAAAATNGTNISLTAQNAGAGNQNGGNIILTSGDPTGSGSAGVVKSAGAFLVQYNTLNPRIETKTNGGAQLIGLIGATLQFAPGDFSAYDTQLYRGGSNQLRTPGSLIVDGNVGIGTTAPITGTRLDITGTGAAASSIIIPRDTVANRPATGVNGMLRYASDTNKFEGYQNGAWTNLVSAATGANSDITSLTALTSATSSGALSVSSASGSALTLGNSGASSSVAINSPTITVGGASTTSITDGSTALTTLNLGGAATGTLTSTLGSTASASATTVQSGTGGTTISSSGNSLLTSSKVAAGATTVSTTGGTTATTLITSNGTSGTSVNITSTGAGGGISLTPNATGLINLNGKVQATNYVDIQGTSLPITSPNGMITIDSTDAQAAGVGGMLTLGGNDGTAQRGFANIGGFKENATSGNYAGYLAFATRANGSAPAERMRIDSSGNVGIGTTSPSSILGLDGTAARTIAMERHTTANTAGNNLTLQSGGATSGATNKNGGTLVLSSGISTGTGASTLQFQTATAGSTGTANNTPTTKMTIDGDGNIVMNMTANSSPLALDINKSTSFTNEAYVSMSNTDANGDSGFMNYNNSGGRIIKLWSGGTSYSPTLYQNRATLTNGSATNGGIGLEAIGSSADIRFSTAGDLTAKERMRIDSSGNVGIGTTGPNSTLDVNGTAAVNSSVESASSYVNSTAAYTILDSSVNIRRITLSANTTITLPAFATLTGKVWTLTVFVKQDATGSRTLAWTPPAGDSILWDQSAVAPVPASAATKITIYQFTKPADETTWYGSLVWKQN